MTTNTRQSLSDELDSLPHENAGLNNRSPMGDDVSYSELMLGNLKEEATTSTAPRLSTTMLEAWASLPVEIRTALVSSEMGMNESFSSNMLAFTTPVNDDSKTIMTYENVSLGNFKGSLKLYPGFLLFESKDGKKKIKLPWDQMNKHMISPATSNKTLLRIISKKNVSKVFTLPTRGSLLKIQKDIKRRRSSVEAEKKGTSQTEQKSSSETPTSSTKTTPQALKDESENPAENQTETQPIKPVKEEDCTTSTETISIDATLTTEDASAASDQRDNISQAGSTESASDTSSRWASHSGPVSPIPRFPQRKKTGEDIPELRSSISAQNDTAPPKIPRVKRPSKTVKFSEADKRAEKEAQQSEEEKYSKIQEEARKLSGKDWLIRRMSHETPKQENQELPEKEQSAADDDSAAESEEGDKAMDMSFSAISGRSRRCSDQSADGTMNFQDDELEAIIQNSFGMVASKPEMEEESKEDEPIKTALSAEMEKEARKSRMSVRMSTRVSAMNNNRMSVTSRRTSTRMSLGGSTRMSTRMSVSRRGSNGFTMLKDLEERDEFMKLQMGAFLRELHHIAEEEAKEKMRDSLQQKQDRSGTISLHGVDLSALSPEKAKEAITALHGGQKMDGDSLILLIQAAVDMLSQEENVVDLREIQPTLSKVTAVGDLHGSWECLAKVLEFADIDNIDPGHVIVFDGDFVDRGHNSLEVIITLLLLKLSRPQNVFLLRGNHEDSMTASSYGFRDEVEEKYGYEKGDEVWWEFGLLFAAFPICARSNTAAIMHGGIPVEEFCLQDLNDIPKETRCEIKSVSDPYDDDERLIQGVLWSDPAEEDGVNFSDRGAGVTFGPDITKDFLDRHELKFIIRAHEVVETGHCHHDVGDGRGVITIFSTANYPAGEGTNSGAVLFLDDKNGVYETKSFIHKELTNEKDELVLFETFLGTVVTGHKSQLIKAFREKQDDNGHVKIEEWADTLAELLDLPETELTFLDLQPDVAPTVDGNGEKIDWMAFLSKYTIVPTMQKGQLAALSEHRDKLLDVFQLLDADGSGTIDKEEFTSGMKMLNEQMPDMQKLEGAAELFDTVDKDGDGEISIEELAKALEESAALKEVTEHLDGDTMASLNQNQDMLTVCYRYLDSNESGKVTREQFQKVFDAVNERMTEKTRFKDPQEWFDMLDEDGKGEFDFNGFKHVFCAL